MRLTGRIRPGDERGAVLLVMAVAIPVFLLIIAMAIDFGNWYAHKRQLQTRVDAGALAAAVGYQMAFNVCADTTVSTTPAERADAEKTITDAVQKYAGYAQGDFNTSHDDVESGLQITVNGGLASQGPCYDHPNGGGYWTQVNADATKVPSFFSGFGVPKPKIVASARLALVRPRGGMQPFVIANPTGTLDQSTIRAISAGADCAPGSTPDLATTFREGCAGPFAVSTASSCGTSTRTAPANSTGPFDCVGSLGGGQLASLGTEFDDRWAPGGTCTPSNWPVPTPDDPRLVTIFLTDSVSGNPSDYRITGYAAFYVRGWSGAPSSCIGINATLAGTGPGDVWGNVLTHYALPASRLPATTTPCTGGGILLCSAALVE